MEIINNLLNKEKDQDTETLYATKCDLEVKHREIIKEVENRFATNDTVRAMASELSEIKGKIDKIYEILINKDK